MKKAVLTLGAIALGLMSTTAMADQSMMNQQGGQQMMMQGGQQQMMQQGGGLREYIMKCHQTGNPQSTECSDLVNKVLSMNFPSNPQMMMQNGGQMMQDGSQMMPNDGSQQMQPISG